MPETTVLNPLYGGNFTCADATERAFVLPGELISTEPLAILQPANHRVQPACPHFGACGGCQYQHADYAEQLNLKLQILKGIFADQHLEAPAEIATHQASEWGYRNRIRLRVEYADGELQVGYNQRGSNAFLPIQACPIATPLLLRAGLTLTTLAQDSVCRRWLAATAEVELFCLPDESRLQAMFFLRDPSPDRDAPGSFSQFCERLQRTLPELAGAGAEVDPELNRRVRKTWAGATWGAAGLSYPVAGRTYWVARGAFFQVNRFLVDRLVELVCAGTKGKLAWDLFAGVGLFTRALAETFEQVVAVEGGEAAAIALAIAGKSKPSFQAMRSSTLDFLRQRALERERPELIVLDPPRAGLGVEGSELLARLNVAQIVYVSCDPVTLARDLAVLTVKAYRIESVELVDLFPQTFHMETVVRLERKA